MPGDPVWTSGVAPNSLLGVLALNSGHLTSSPNQASPCQVVPPAEGGTLQGLSPCLSQARNHSPDLLSTFRKEWLMPSTEVCVCSEHRKILTGSLMIKTTAKVTCSGTCL